MHLLALDPGYTHSALVELQDERIGRKLYAPNLEVIDWLQQEAAWRLSAGHPLPVLVIEQVENYGLVVGAETFETCHWGGRFHQAWPGKVERIPRRVVKLALCGTPRAKDPHIRQALIDRYGPSKELAIGKKAQPGPLHGIAKHEWAALAVGVAYQQEAALAARHKEDQ